MLYNFKNLRVFLDKIAPLPAQIRQQNLIIEGEDFTKKAKEGNVEYRSDGIFVKINGMEFQRYIYKKYYSVTYGGKVNFPKFHFIQCSTVSDYGIANYYSASKDKVLVIDKYTKRKYPDKVLNICRNCIKEATVSVPRDTEAFFQKLDKKTPEEFMAQEVDIFGYTFDWQEIRANYLEQHGNKCEQCTIEMEGLDTRYLHIHHKNRDKKYNHSSNLECLCIVCHSCVDERHIENFKKKRMNVELKEFLEKYINQLRAVKNRYVLSAEGRQN